MSNEFKAAQDVLDALTLRLAKQEKQTMINTIAIAGLTSNSTGPVSPPPPATRTLPFPHARFRTILRSPSRDITSDRAWYNSHISDIEDGSTNGTMLGHPNAISVQQYLLIARTEVDGGAVYTSNGLGGGSWSPASDDSSNPSGSCAIWSATYATANGLDVEDFWLHVRTGDKNFESGIWSISVAGVVLFNSPSSVGLSSSFPFIPGQTVSISGLPTGSGSYTIASVQKSGVTLGDYTGAAYGSGIPNSASTSKVGSLYVPGDGTKTKANRKWTFYFTEWRNTPYFGNPGCRQMHAARVAYVVSGRGDPTRAFNTAFFDETASNAYSISNITSVEYGTTGGAAFGQLTSCPFAIDLAQCMVELRAYPNGPKFIRINTSDFTFYNDILVARGAGGIHGENLLGRFSGGQTALDFYIARVNEGIDVELVDGGVWKLASANGGATPNPGIWLEHSGTISGNYPDVSTKGQMSSYVYYLLGVDPIQTNPDGTTFRHAIFDMTNSCNPQDSPASARWQLAYEYDIGQPVGAKVKSAVLLDPAGLATQTHARSFSKDGGTTLSTWTGYVSTVSGQTNWGVTSQMTLTPPVAPPGKAWYMLNGNGTFGTTALTTVLLARSEGIILVAL